MTTETDLLPLHYDELPEIPEDIVVRMQFYARANVARAVAPLQAEIEALRAEVKDYRENGASAVRFAPNSAYWSAELRRLFGDDARNGIEVLEQWHRDSLTRAERLAEALRDCLDLIETITPVEGDTVRKSRALLRDQEEGGDQVPRLHRSGA